jgi:alpha-mannosidase
MNRDSSSDSRPTVHLIGHAHIDPVWLWRWQEGYSEVRSTFRSALDRMKETPGYIFTCSSAALYEWVEQSDPAMFREILRRVKEGRWAPIGGWWIEPDCNIPCGESLVRQGLYGQRYFREKLGVQSTVGFCPDTFGHTGTLPKILAGCGMPNYVFMRPMRHENEGIPELAFTWKGDDGTQVKALRVHESYNAWTTDELYGRMKDTLAVAEGTPIAGEIFLFFGVGNHGGGPTKAMLKQIGLWQKQNEMPRLLFSTFEDALDRIDSGRLSNWRGELQHHARGCYTAVSAIKAGMRRAELSLLQAEMWGSAARTAVKRTPDTGGLRCAWKHVLFNQFHDILAGTSTPEAYVDAEHQLGAASHAGDCEANAARQAICGRIDTRGEGDPLVLFNHQPVSFRGVVETDDLGFHIQEDKSVVPGLTRPGAGPVASQQIETNTIAGRRRFAVHIEIPALGYTVLHQASVPGQATKRQLGRRAVRTNGNYLENEFLRVGLDRRGYVTLYDRRHRRQVFRKAGAIPLVMEDHSDTWSHDVVSYRKVLGRFKRVSARVLEAGPVQGCLEVNYAWDLSRLRLLFTLGADEAFMKIRGRVDWRQTFQTLKLSFPVPFKAESWTAAAAYGIAERKTDGGEEPVQQWVDLSIEDRGIAVANDAKYACSANPDDLRMTLLRSPPYALHNPWTTDDFTRFEFTDQGPQTFRMTVLPHAGSWREAGIVDLAAQLNVPPSSLPESAHAGSLPSAGGFVRSRGKGVRIEAIKESEDGKGLILRAVEWFGRRRKATFELPGSGRSWKAAFRPHEVKTFQIPHLARSPVREVNMLEDQQPSR